MGSQPRAAEVHSLATGLAKRSGEAVGVGAREGAPVGGDRGLSSADLGPGLVAGNVAGGLRYKPRHIP